MDHNPHEKAIDLFRQHNNLLHTRQATRLGIAPRTLYDLRDNGLIIQISRGLFRLAEAPPDIHSDLVHVAVRVPKAVICLISALSYYELTTQIPHHVYIALPIDAEMPRVEYPPIQVFWLTSNPYGAGMEEIRLEGEIVRIYKPAKTVADCFKYRNRIGLDVAIEALRLCIQTNRCQVDELSQFAKIDRVERIMRPYLESML